MQAILKMSMFTVKLTVVWHCSRCKVMYKKISMQKIIQLFLPESSFLTIKIHTTLIIKYIYMGYKIHLKI